MNEAMERITSAGANAKPADWDGYFTARQRVETAEEDLKKQQWMEESQDLRTPKEPYRRGQFNKGQGGQRDAKASANGKGYPQRRPQADRNTARSQPIVATKVNYNDSVFPPQIRWKDENSQPAIFTRHDKTSQLPKGLMLAASRELSQEEKAQLVNYVKYQHTISTRSGKDLKTIADNDVVFNHTGRSVYVRTQFEDAEQVKGFHDALSQMMSNGTAPRKDGTQKHEAFGDKNAEFALYYNN
jgi:hypothetical protein